LLRSLQRHGKARLLDCAWHRAMDGRAASVAGRHRTIGRGSSASAARLTRLDMLGGSA